MRSFKIPERSQKLLFTDIDLNTVAPVGSPVYIIDRFVDQLDTTKIEEEYNLESETGRLPFHPKTMLKVALYAIHNCRFSLRKMEYDTINHLGYRWLTGDEKIDHSTMGRFLVKHKEYIVDMFAEIVEIGVAKELINFDILAIDTVKLRANASYKHFRNLEGLEKEQQKIKEKLEKLMEDAIENNIHEIEALKAKQDLIEFAAQELQKKIQLKHPDKITDEVSKEKINLVDFDCQLVQQANGEINSGYCITTTTDTGNDLITGFTLNENNDAQILMEAIETSEQNTGVEHDVVVADSGFSSIDNLEKLEEKNQKALIPDRRLEAEQKKQTKKGEYDRSNFKYNESNDEYKCPEGKKLEYVGEHSNNGRTYDRYSNKDACKKCANRNKCTKSKYRIIVRDRNENIKEEMRERLKKKKNKTKYKKRSHSAESPYGQIKHNLKFRIFMRRGYEKIKMECSLLFSLHNILKIGKKELEYA